MNISLNRIILFVNDVSALKRFYQTVFGFAVTEEIENEWVVFTTGTAELALHKIGQPFAHTNTPKRQTNVKFVFEAPGDMHGIREELISKNVPMGDVKYFDKRYLLCDGEDSEGNVFQLKVKR